ncbi:MAG: DUF1640 domain-containing protein [Magnetococcales bacterium]|nr:DUF1640 domain-containing protein [Magnetococcales bacterium]
MATLAFDTLKFMETLQASGFNDAQAKGIVSVLRGAQEAHLDELATKRDLKELELRLEQRMSDNKTDLLKWVGGMFAAQTALILAAMFALMRGAGHG